MADSITDGRTLITAADGVAGFVGLGGGGSGTLDTEIFIQGTGSIGNYVTNTRTGLLFDTGADQDWSNNTFYIWINSGIVGLLATKAAGGLTIRFCGAAVTNFFEVYVAGSDDWPAAVSGGWTMFAVSIETARATAITNGWTGGTPPATTAIRYVGYSAVTGGTMPRMVDNTWIDAMWRLPAGTAGILVQGRSGGTTDWNWDNVVATSQANAWGTAKFGAGGAVALNTPIQFFVNDGTTHSFSDSNRVILWENQDFVAPDLYGFRILGAGVGTANFVAGVKTGTGSTATGSQGWVVAAAASGVRWFLEADAASIDLCGIYGCTFIHANDLYVGATSTEIISTQLIDCSLCVPDGASAFQFNSVIDANTAGSTTSTANGFIDSADPSDIENCDFQFSDTHAIDINTTGTFTFIGNTFSGYGATGSATSALANSSGGAVTINIAGGGDVPTFTNVVGGSSTTIVASFTLTLTGIPVDVLVTIVDSTTRTELFNVTSTGADVVYTHGGGDTVDVLFNSLLYDPNISDLFDFLLPSADQTIPIAFFEDLNYVNPP